MTSRIPELDRWFPPRGPCAFCGHEDARHRLWDAIMDGGMLADEAAREYGLPPEAVRLVREIRPYRRSR